MKWAIGIFFDRNEAASFLKNKPPVLHLGNGRLPKPPNEQPSSRGGEHKILIFADATQTIAVESNVFSNRGQNEFARADSAYQRYGGSR